VVIPIVVIPNVVSPNVVSPNVVIRWRSSGGGHPVAVIR
jgi:hypothetical protein